MPSCVNSKKTMPRQRILKLPKTKEPILKVTREKRLITYKRIRNQKTTHLGASLVVQWLRIYLAM